MKVLFDVVDPTITLACMRCGTQARENDLAQEALMRWLNCFVSVHGTCSRAPADGQLVEMQAT